MSTAAARVSEALAGMRTLMAKIAPLAHPLATKAKLMQAQMVRSVTAAAGAGAGAASAAPMTTADEVLAASAVSTSAAGSELGGLVHGLCSLAEEWMVSAASPPGDPLGLQCACGMAVLSALAAQASQQPPSALSLRVRVPFLGHYSTDHVRSLMPTPPWHHDGLVAPVALRRLQLVLRLLGPMLPANELGYRTKAVRDGIAFLVPRDTPPRALVPHRDVALALVQLWSGAPATCPDIERVRTEEAVRWLCLLPSTTPPSKAAAERIRVTKETLVQFIAQPWQSQAGSSAAAASGSSDVSAVDKFALETLTSVFVFQMGAPLVSFEAGHAMPLPSVFAADLIRTIPLHYTAQVTDRVRLFAAPLGPAVLLPPVSHPAGSGDSAATSSLAAVSGSGQQSESNLIAALLSMIDWGLDDRIEPWVSALVDGICLAHKFELMRHFAQSYAHAAILVQMQQTQTRMGAFHLLRKLLLGDSTQPAAFLSCVGGFVQVTQKLKTELDEAASSLTAAQPPSLEFIRSYSLLLRSLMYCHTGHPTEYVPLVEALKELEGAAATMYSLSIPLDLVAATMPPSSSAAAQQLVPVIVPTEREMQEEVKKGAWSGAASSVASSSSSSSANSSAASSSSSAVAIRQKSSTGKVGLDNVGNSCYLSSVLQSLMLTDSFRRTLLRIDRAHLPYSFLRQNPILTNMQTIFGFLMLSHRHSFNPSTLHKALPDMFRDASQQDAGEFAKYVLDVIGTSLKALKELPPTTLAAPVQVKSTASSAAASPTVTTLLVPASPVALAATAPTSADVVMATAVSPSNQAVTAIVVTSPASPHALQATTLRSRNNSTSTAMLVDDVGVKGGSSTTAAVAPVVATLVTAALSPAAASSASIAATSTVATPAAAVATAATPSPASTNVAILQDEFFGGHFLSELTCSVCGTCSSKKEPFLEIPLALEIEQVKETDPSSAATPATTAIIPAASSSSSSSAPAPKPALIQALELAQADADRPLTNIEQFGAELQARPGVAAKPNAAADISSIISGFLPPASATTEDEEEAAYMKDIIASLPTEGAPASTTAPTSDAAALAASCMLAMAAQTMVSAAAASATAAAVTPSVAANSTAAPASTSTPTATSTDASSSSSTAAPAPAPAAAAAPVAAAKSPPAPSYVVPSGPLHLSAMLAHYFSPEVLSGSNAYYCSTCATKRTASKQLRVLTPAPAHLLMCLKRNTYEFKNGALVRNKIMKEVKYPCVLRVPVLEVNETPSAAEGAAASASSSSSSTSAAPAASSSRRSLFKTYVLYSVIVHSGTSAQHGHYYTISRASDEEALAQVLSTPASTLAAAFARADTTSEEVSPELEAAARGGKWYQFNDSTVSAASFDALENLTATLPSDVAYLLFYRDLDAITAMATAATTGEQLTDPSLFRTVQKDNSKFMVELAAASKLQTRLSALETNYASKRNEPPSDAEFDSDMS